MIKDINALLSERKHKRYLCRNCNVSSFTSKNSLDNHSITCRNNNQNTTETVLENEEKLYCTNCLNKSFKTKETFRNHMLSCLVNIPFKVQIPNKYNNILAFEKYYMQSEIPFRIYCDFETVNIKDNDQKFKQNHQAIQ